MTMAGQDGAAKWCRDPGFLGRCAARLQDMMEDPKVGGEDIAYAQVQPTKRAALMTLVASPGLLEPGFYFVADVVRLCWNGGTDVKLKL